VLRLTLRTLLAYLDDTLEPAEARAIGQKVAESESARELVERIKQVTRRRRLTTPPASGPGGNIDANTVAEYLDNAVTPEQAAEVEQICLSSDVHLAEVAACHQTLTLILGEPVRPPAAASQRMYGLVKGPGAIPFRKPAASKTKPTSEPYAEHKDIDETLRLGLPALGRHGGWRNPLLLIGGGVLAAALLVLAIFQVLSLPGDSGHKSDPVAQSDKNKTDFGKENGKQKEDEKGAKSSPAVDKKGDESKATDPKAPSTDNKVDDKKDPGTVVPIPPSVEVAFGPPNPRHAPIGHYVPDAKESSILLQSFPDSKFEWKRLTAKQSEVYSAQPLLSLPGSRSAVQTNRGVRLTLWGNMPEFISAVPVFESLVELYAHDTLDLDMLLQRGRVVLTSTRQDKPVSIRLRFENPLVPSDKDAVARQEFFDIKLPKEGDTILVDRWSSFPTTEPFYKDPKNPKRIGPTADMVCMVLNGTVVLKTGDVTSTMTAPPGPGLLLWNSLTGPKGPSNLAKPLDFALANPSALPGMDPKLMVKARDYLSAQLATSNVDVGLAQPQGLYSADPSTRRLVVRSLAAVSDLPSLLEALDQSKLADVRLRAIEALRNWVAASRDNDYKLYNLLKAKYKGKEPEIIMEMMHSFSEAERRRPERYELLIDYLVNPNLVIRELSAWHLYQLVPAGKHIPFAADADSSVRERAEAQWRALIPQGQLPPAAAGGSKTKQ
jgi:hypothetical protein